MFTIYLIQTVFVLVLVYGFSKEIVGLLGSWRRGVVAGDTQLKTPVERVADPRQFKVLFRNKVMSLIARVLVALFVVSWMFSVVIGHQVAAPRPSVALTPGGPALT